MTRGRFALAVPALIGAILLAGWCVADEPAATPPTYDARLAEHDALIRQLRPLLTGADPLAAIDTVEKLSNLERELITYLEAHSPEKRDQLKQLREVVGLRLDWLADAYTQQEKWDLAIGRRTTAANLFEKFYGAEYWKTRRAKTAISETQAISRLGADQRKLLAAAKQMEQQARAQTNKSPAEAIRLWEQIAAVRSSVLGEKDSSFAFAEEQLGLCYMVHGAPATRSDSSGSRQSQYVPFARSGHLAS